MKRLAVPRRHVIPRSAATRELFLCLLAAAAVLYQGLIPAGYMLGTRSELAAGSLIVPCPAQNEPAFLQGLATQTHAHHHHHDGGEGHKSHTLAAGQCVFAAAAAAGLPTGSISTPAALPPAEGLIVQRAMSARVANYRSRPPVRGPPAFS